jgi:flavin-binding protein dodecin
MKKIRLLVVAPSDEMFNQAIEGLPEEAKKNLDLIRKNMVVHYKQIIQTALRTPLSPQGVAIEEMEKSLNVLKVVDVVEEGGVLELEDADHEYLLQKLAQVRWQGFDPRVVTFVHTVKNATKDLLDESPEETRANGVAELVEPARA